MGCDIHFYVERRDGPSSPWVTADAWAPDEYEPERLSVPYGQAFYDDRNYDLFAILADVRNGHGFAGVRTGEGFVPMALPRGVPDDACAEYRSETERWDGDGHSHSWVTVAEVLAYDWTQTTVKSGYVGIGEWAVWRDSRGAGPNSWSGMISGGGVTHHAPEEFEAAWQAVRAARGYPEQRQPSSHLRYDDGHEVERAMQAILGSRSPHTQVSWTIPYYKAGQQFLGETLPRLLRLGGHDDVRCLYFFNN